MTFEGAGARNDFGMGGLLLYGAHMVTVDHCGWSGLVLAMSVTYIDHIVYRPIQNVVMFVVYTLELHDGAQHYGLINAQTVHGGA